MLEDLESQQYEPLYQEEDVPLLDIRKGVLRHLTWGVIVLLLVLGGIGASFRFPNQITVPYVLKNSQSEEIYQFNKTVFALEKLVSEQEVVQEGQYW